MYVTLKKTISRCILYRLNESKRLVFFSVKKKNGSWITYININQKEPRSYFFFVLHRHSLSPKKILQLVLICNTTVNLVYFIDIFFLCVESHKSISLRFFNDEKETGEHIICNCNALQVSMTA